jgi:DNA-binding NarL/FixJ family response regulator
MPKPIRVMVIDPHPIFRKGVIATLQRSEELMLMGEGATVDDARRILRDKASEALMLEVAIAEVLRWPRTWSKAAQSGDAGFSRALAADGPPRACASCRDHGAGAPMSIFRRRLRTRVLTQPAPKQEERDGVK